MSDCVLKPTIAVRTGGLHALLRRFFAKDGPCLLPTGELQRLPDHVLVDIGVDPRDVPRHADEAADRLGLLDRGWSRPRSTRRR